MKLGIVCSSGGHLAQLIRLRPWWGEHDRFWVTFDKVDARDRLRGERVYHAHHPTNRNLRNLWRNARLARRVLCQERPDVLLSNGAGVALPFFAWGRVQGVPLIYLEVFDRVDRPSLTGRLVAPLIDAMAVEWQAQRAAWPQAVVLGEQP